MQQEIRLLVERLVVAVEGISDDVSKIWISLNDMNTNITYLVSKERRTDMPDLSLLPNTIEQTTTATTDVPCATCLDEQPVYIESANTCLVDDNDENVDISKEAEDKKVLPVQETSSVDTHLFTSVCSIHDEGEHGITSLEKSCQPTIKAEPTDVDADCTLTLERPYGDTEAMLGTKENLPADTLDDSPLYVGEANEIPEQMNQKDFITKISDLQSAGNAINISDRFNNPGYTDNQVELSSVKYSLKKDNALSLKEVSCLKKTNKHKEKDKEPLFNALCLTVKEIKRDAGDKNASNESVREQTETESKRECCDNRVHTNTQEVAAFGKSDEGTSSMSRSRSMHDKKHVECKKPFCCEACGKCFQCNSVLEALRCLHTDVKPFKCSLCSKSFAQKCHLDTHLSLHTGDRPFRCPVCEKAFKLGHHLSNHMRQHTGEKPFTCLVCKKGFSQKGNLSSHMYRHTGEKPFKCSFCEKRFARRDLLNAHKRVHTGEKPFKCEFCGRSFTQSHLLSYHVYTHTGEKPFKCSLCPKSFVQSADLNRHMQTHSREWK